jgi:hypothetical protein
MISQEKTVLFKITCCRRSLNFMKTGAEAETNRYGSVTLVTQMNNRYQNFAHT